jgi:sentrin-specific protease 8
MLALHHYQDSEIVINYNDALIFGRDLALFESKTAWLNDACIFYQLARLQQQYDPSAQALLFLDPAVVSFLMHQVQDEDEMRDFASGYHHFRRTKRILVPINDNMGSSHWQTPGLGSHWSLLVVILPLAKVSSRFFHFDSVVGSNRGAAQAVACKLYQAIQLAKQWSNFNEQGGTLETTVLMDECTAPQQKNGFDCGMHVLANAEVLRGDDVDDYEENGPGRLAERDPCFPEHLRSRIAQDIRQLASLAASKP